LLRAATLEAAGQKDATLRWAREWQAKLPEDSRTTTDRMRLLTPAGKKDEPLKIATDYLTKQVEATQTQVAASAASMPKDGADKIVDRTRASALLAAASGLAQAKAYDEAESRCREALKYQPTDERALQLLGTIAVERKDWDGALAVYGE